MNGRGAPSCERDDVEDSRSRRPRWSAGGQGVASATTIAIGGCPADVSVREVRQACQRRGHEAGDVWIKHSQRGTLAFADFGSAVQTREAMRGLDQTRLFGDGPIKVSMATKTEGADASEDGYGKSRGRREDERCGPRGESHGSEKRGRNGERAWDDWERERSHQNGRNGAAGDGARSRSRLLNGKEPPQKLQPRGTSPARSGSRGAVGEAEIKPPEAPVEKAPRPIILQEKCDAANAFKQGVNKDRRGQVRVNLWQLPLDFDEDELLDMASDYGTVRTHQLWQEKHQMCAMVEFSARDEAMAALNGLHNRKMEGWRMFLKLLVCD